MENIVIDYDSIDEKIDIFLEEILEEDEDTEGGLPPFSDIDLIYLYCHLEQLSVFGKIAMSVVIRRLEDFDANLTECSILQLQPMTQHIVRKFLQDELMSGFGADEFVHLCQDDSSDDDSDIGSNGSAY